MKIKKLKFIDHPILGNLQLDFTDSSGSAIDTIIVAGENGAGKSVLLNELYNLYNTYNRTIKGEHEYFVSIEIEVSDADILFFEKEMPTHGQNKIDWNIKEVHTQYNVATSGVSSMTLKIDHYVIKKSDNVKNKVVGYDIMHVLKPAMKRIFSDIGIDYTSNNITSVTAKNIDEYIRHEKSNNNIATDISQLLIDISVLDNSDLAIWVKENVDIAPSAYVIDKRIRRFTKAFEFMFTNKKFKNVINDTGIKDVIFEEANKEVSISALSSGEKQIVFRGSFLLKNKESIKGALVLIDEPEISLHPSWQLKILDYYKKLFQDENGNQTSQMFVVTHSPFIIHNANRSNDKVIILKKKDDGTIEVSDKQEFYGWTNSQLIQEAFNIDLFADTTPVVFLEGETDEKYFNKAIEVYKISTNIKFKWIGRVNNNQAEFTGDKSLNQARAFILANEGLIKNKIVLLYDCDTNKPKEDYSQLLIRSMNANYGNTLYKKGIENLLELPHGFDSNSYYSEINKVDDNSAVSIIRSLDKTKLCEAICIMEIEQQKNIFHNIKECIEGLIREI